MLNEREKNLLIAFCAAKEMPVPTSGNEAKFLQLEFEKGGVSTLPTTIFWLLEKFEADNTVKKINPKKAQRAESKRTRSRWQS